ncbi:hypothetical protein BHE74_00015315 [Ensete ventricosum]|nr:hypothetical protein BHE74_00015315 [Ensete ventricosum]RZS02033.1 hypothetical protein BHM03_00032002 [Ensete ventricosum]
MGGGKEGGLEEGEAGIGWHGEGSAEEPDGLRLRDLQLPNALELPCAALHRHLFFLLFACDVYFEEEEDVRRESLEIQQRGAARLRCRFVRVSEGRSDREILVRGRITKHDFYEKALRKKEY